MQNCGGDKTVLSAQDLQNIMVNTKQHAADTVAAATYLLMHKEAFDGAKGLASDDTSTAADDSVGQFANLNPDTGAAGDVTSMLDAILNDPSLQAAMASTSANPIDLPDDPQESAQAMQTLLDDAALWVGKDGITAQDLQNVIDNPAQHPPETVAAATYLLGHPDTFNQADGAASGGAIDGQIWKQDLVAAIDQAGAHAAASSTGAVSVDGAAPDISVDSALDTTAASAPDVPATSATSVDDLLRQQQQRDFDNIVAAQVAGVKAWAGDAAGVSTEF